MKTPRRNTGKQNSYEFIDKASRIIFTRLIGILIYCYCGYLAFKSLQMHTVSIDIIITLAVLLLFGTAAFLSKATSSDDEEIHGP
jgi:hypothetical protein